MKHAQLLALLLPLESYAPSVAPLAQELAAEGNALDATLASTSLAEGGITPFFAAQLLPDWERVCGITPTNGASYQQRQQMVIAKLAEVGGLSIPYFKRLAAGMGYTIEINEPQPFRAGINRAGDQLWTADIIWVWRVVVKTGNVRAFSFRAGLSAAGEALTAFGDAIIETVFNDLKPAHTFVYFAYQEA
ncbi:YmfQ family protein [Cupriavidus sp. 30B13]|uniref:YmfQ family protein n=1 Tax=Cupriavidus sp. 30B13 TaxID=3384241 RepID=UPI003B8EEBFB